MEAVRPDGRSPVVTNPGRRRSMADAVRWAAIEEEIASDQSPVGIDAKKTHVMILLMLERIEARLERLEARVGGA